MREARGRPLRALAVVLGGWIALRVAWLWPADVAERGVPATGRAVAERARPAAGARVAVAVTASRGARPLPAPHSVGPVAGRWRAVDPPASGPVAPVASAAAAEPGGEDTGHVLALAGIVRYGAAEPRPPGASRWSGSAWAILRGAGGSGDVATPQLGASQAGVRLSYALNARVAVAARVAGAIGTRQQDAAIGIEWQPTRLPVRLIAEQRIAIAGARGGASVGVVGGVSGARLPLGLALDGYAQAGAIARDGGEGYADGAVRVGRKVSGALDLGIGAWGAAQRGAARLDVGPSLAVTVPLATQRVRVSLDWRHRIAGDARPVSGPALSIGTDF